MIRAAAKNHSHVAVVVDPNDYDELLQHLSGDSGSTEAVLYRKRLAWKAFQHCATYDSTVAEWLWTQIGTHAPRCEMLQLTACLPTVCAAPSPLLVCSNTGCIEFAEAHFILQIHLIVCSSAFEFNT